MELEQASEGDFAAIIDLIKKDAAKAKVQDETK